MSQKMQRSFVVVIVLRAVHFLAHALGDDRQGDQLGMRVFERGAGSFTVILEEQNVAEAAVVFQVEHAVAISPQHFFHLLFATSSPAWLYDRAFR